MTLKSVLILLVIIILIIIIIRYIMKGASTLTSLISAKTMQKIDPSSLNSTSSGASTSNFAYSIWFFIDDWNYRYGEPKVIYGRMASGAGITEPCPSVVLGPIQNNIIVSLAVYPGEIVPSDSTNFVTETCSIANVPIQKWVNLFVSVYGRTLDIYLDGKLVKTCVLAGVAKIDSTAPIYVTPMGGFSGWTSKFQYWPASGNPQQAWNIYKSGYGGSLFGFLGKYSVKIALMEGDTEDNSITF